ncbi:hypothetical protein BaRGS_00002345 [Batillaria attramentaria]|uniref:Secreted protein n=1 Tax=Batillaria attramentaria TaxID=370345 RepID=A0ABD0M4C1_9CAEN
MVVFIAQGSVHLLLLTVGILTFDFSRPGLERASLTFQLYFILCCKRGFPEWPSGTLVASGAASAVNWLFTSTFFQFFLRQAAAVVVHQASQW